MRSLLRNWRFVWSLSTVALVLVSDGLISQSRADQEGRREQWQKVPQILAAMNVRPGATVADIGAGDGFFTTRLARAVQSSGRVYAVDIDDSAIDRLRKRLQQDGIQNVIVVKGAPDSPNLPEGVIDAALIVNAYHEMDQHQSMLSALRRALKPEGRLVIVEPVGASRRGRSRAEQTRNHEIDPEHVLQDARSAGFRVVGLQDPFTVRGGDLEWLMALQPGDLPAPTTAAAVDLGETASAALKDPSLRISHEELTTLASGGHVTIVDVRDHDSFAAGRIPGALSIPLETVENAVERLRRLSRPVVTYCS